MRRYLRLYGCFLRFSFSRAMEFRVDFFFRVVMDLIFYAVNIAFYDVIFLHTPELGGWTQEQAMVFVGCFLLLDALNMTVVANNLYELPFLINRGDLDYYLIRPVSSLFLLSLQDFAANSFVNLLMAGGLLGYFLAQYSGAVSAAGVALLVVALGLGFLLRCFMHLLVIVPVFWWHSGRGLEIAFWHMARFIERPDRIYAGWARRILTTVAPFALMASFPARLLLEPFRPGVLLQLALTTLVFGLLMGVAWRAGLRAYSSASS